MIKVDFVNTIFLVSTMPPVKKAQSSTSVVQKDVNIEACLLHLRNLCRTHGLQIWNKQSLSDQIYQDLLFIWHIPRLVSKGLLTLDLVNIGGKITEISYKSLLALKEEKVIAGDFKLLWRSLQSSEVSKFFDGRDFGMFSIEKNEKKADKYFKLLKDIIQYFASIEIQPYDSNAGYTYFKNDLNKGTAKTFGQFYTPRSVVASIVNQVNPKAGEKTLDPSSGSCSFIQAAAQKLIDTYGLSPEEAFQNLYGVEVEHNIYQEGVMHTFLQFGIIPNMEHNIREDDSFQVLLQEEQKFDKILANPPFGADASSFFELYFKNETVKKGKRDVKVKVVNPDVKVEIPFTNTKESAILFFQLIIQKLVDGGKAGVVMSSTILNDGNNDMMKWFLECCSLEKVIINPAGTFKEKGTGIETFSFIFTKGSPTTKVDIVMLGAEDDVVRSLTLDQIKEAGWKLQLKEEEKKVEYTGEYEMKKLGDLLDDVTTGKNIPSSERIDGIFKFFTCSRDYDTHNEFHYDGTYIVHGSRGSTIDESVFLTENEKFAIGTSMFLSKVKNESELLSGFIYYYLKFNRSIVNRHVNSTAIPMISKTNYYTIEILCPPLPIQQEIVGNLDRIFADPQEMKDCLAFTDKAMDLMLKDPSGKLLEDVMGGLRLKRSQLAAASSIKAQMAAVVRSVGGRGFEVKKLGDVCSFVNGYAFKSEEFIETGIPVVKITTIKDNVIKLEKACYVKKNNKLNGFIVKNGDFVVALSGATVGIIGINTTGTECYLNQRVARIDVTSSLTTTRFIYLAMIYGGYIEIIRELAGGSAQPNVSTKKIEELDIPIPPLPIQQEVLAILNEMEAEMKTFEQMAEKSEQRAKYILDGYLAS